MNNERAVELLKSLLKINTTNPPGNEAKAVALIQPLFEAAGIDTEVVTYSENRHQLIATLKGEEPGKVLAFTGHMDVVPVGEIPWDYPPFGAEEADGKIFGRGASDMKSGLAAMVAAMIQLKEADAPIKGTLKFIATVGEETSSIGAEQLVKSGYADDLDAVLIGEPTDNELSIAEKGALWVRLTTFGKTGHGSTPSCGINANEHMIAILSKFQTEFQFDYEADDLLSEPTSSIDVMHGGNGTNVIPDKCSVEIDMRTLPSQNHKEIISALESLIDTVKKDIPELKATIEILNDMRPVKTPKDDEFVQRLAEVIEDVRRKKIEPYGFSGYTDGAFFSQVEKTFPIAVVGPGYPPVAHQPNEYVEREPFFDSIKIYKKIALDFLS
ncbi:M20 family metallopeptidase [Sporolactobacillus shoreicorticis]|uniref:Probable succinyl-diaminopimelate desuccinylase n=1 Tax=Sporolactobacillus shoreicorticis TaxID=1923877 RepID=A0ABW5S4C1_9BACL|nr:M20 family metallopeptidase [Sporolactobacillus shoreicorticis]MCO7127569.1 M20 family metallopeptidase [Sporolactobacillus shoreicorticis]